MSLDAAFERVVAPILEELTIVRQELSDLKDHLSLSENGLKRPVYDADALQELGYSYRESYEILRSHGFKKNGRLRVIDTNLRRYQTGLTPEFEQSPLPPLPSSRSRRDLTQP